MDVYLIDQSGPVRRDPEELPTLLAEGEGIVWVDIPQCSLHEAAILERVFGFSEIALHDCVTATTSQRSSPTTTTSSRSCTPRRSASSGHVHYIELDQFLGANYLVTIHGPLNPKVDPSVAYLDTGAVLDRMTSGKFRPRTAFELASAIIVSLTRREIDMIASLAEQSGRLEQRVMSGEVMNDSEGFLDRPVPGLVRAARRSARSPCTAARPTTGWPAGPLPAGRPRAAGRRPGRPVRDGVAAWPTGNGSSSTG